MNVSMHCIKHAESVLPLTPKSLMINGNDIMAGFMLYLSTLASLYLGGWCCSAGNWSWYRFAPGKSCDASIGPT